MSDIIDDANATADLHLHVALRNRKHDAIMPTAGVGFCLCCAADLPPERRWCDAECRDAWQKENA